MSTDISFPPSLLHLVSFVILFHFLTYSLHCTALVVGNHIANKQMSIDQLQTMQVIRGKRTTLGPEEAGTHTGLFHAAPGRPRKVDKVKRETTFLSLW